LGGQSVELVWFSGCKPALRIALSIALRLRDVSRGDHHLPLLEFAVRMNKTNAEFVVVQSKKWGELRENGIAVEELFMGFFDSRKTVV